MRLSKIDCSECEKIAREENIPLSVVKNIITSYFDSMVIAAKALQYNNKQRLYTKKAFLENAFVINIPFIGRIGPVYSCYIKWRKQLSKNLEQIKKSALKRFHYGKYLEEEARHALNGEKVNIELFGRPNAKDGYCRVWIIKENDKKVSARQIIVK